MIPFTKQLSGLLITGAVLFTACHSSETRPTDRVSVALHQSARLGSDVTVRADSIQDSRCPVNVNCIWAGNVRVKLLVSSINDSSVVRLGLGADPAGNVTKRPDSTNVTLNNSVYKVILRDVNPYPGTSTTNQPQTAIVQVTKI